MKRLFVWCIVVATVWLKPDTTVVGVSFASVVSGFSRTVVAQTPPKQAVVETSAGTFVIDLAPDSAHNQTAYFMKQAADGAYDGTTFHRVVKYGMVQGGDPLTKDASKRALYGTGGLNAVKAEARAPKMTHGSVAAVLVPGKPDSAGAQFFIVLADQPSLDNQYTVFGRVADGIEVLQKISEAPVDEKGVATERIEIRHVAVRDTPAEPFVSETTAELGAYRAVLDTSDHDRALHRQSAEHRPPVPAARGLGDLQRHGLSPCRPRVRDSDRGAREPRRAAPLTEKQQQLVHNLAPEFNDTKHVKGIVSMARGEAPDSATTSFFICTGPSSALDGRYTAFARVVDGMAAVDAIEASPRNGEAPAARVDLKTVRIEKK